MATIKLKKRNNLLELEKELYKLYKEGYADGRVFQRQSTKAILNYKVHPADRTLQRIINLLKVD